MMIIVVIEAANPNTKETEEVITNTATNTKANARAAWITLTRGHPEDTNMQEMLISLGVLERKDHAWCDVLLL